MTGAAGRSLDRPSILGLVEFRILGPLEVVRDGRSLALGPPQQRAVLGVLVLAHGRVVSAGTLIDAVWTDPPKTAANLVQGYVSGLRRAFSGRPSGATSYARSLPGIASTSPVADGCGTGGSAARAGPQ